MSRIPRVASSPDRELLGTTETCPPLKRKALNDDNPIPGKLPALASAVSGTRILKASTASHINGQRADSALGRVRGPPLLTKPRAPALSVSINGVQQRAARAVSAPPTKRILGTNGAKSTAPGRVGRVPVTGGTRLVTVDDERFTEIQNQMTQMESARANDLAKGVQSLADLSPLSLPLIIVTSDMEAERAKVQELQAFHTQLSKQLAESKTLEIEQRRNLISASDELDVLRKKHAREIMDLEMDRSKLQREVREFKEEVRVGREDLSRERASVSVLKVCYACPFALVPPQFTQ
jgi:kinesin family member C1